MVIDDDDHDCYDDGDDVCDNCDVYDSDYDITILTGKGIFISKYSSEGLIGVNVE